MASSRNWTRIQTQTLETEPYFWRRLEQKNLKKLNNPVKTFLIHNSLSEYPLSLWTQVSLGLSGTKTWNTLSEKWIKCFMRVINKVASLCWWQILRCDRWLTWQKEICLIVELICVVATRTCLNWTM